MGLLTGQTIVQADFSQVSPGTANIVPKSLSTGYIDRSYIGKSFGGTGADGALSITSGTTTLSLGSAAIFIKNYTSISITGTGELTFSTPHNNGTVIALKSQGNVTITSSATVAIDASGMGAAAGTLAHSTAGLKVPNGVSPSSGSGAGGVAPGITTAEFGSLLLAPGAGGGNSVATFSQSAGGGGGGASFTNSGIAGGSGYTSGGNTATGGRGGGALYIECAGAYSCSATISVAGIAGGIPSGGTGAGAGGGGGGTYECLWGTLTSDTGTYTVTGGAAGTGSLCNGGMGGNGQSSVRQNTEFI